MVVWTLNSQCLSAKIYAGMLDKDIHDQNSLWNIIMLFAVFLSRESSSGV